MRSLVLALPILLALSQSARAQHQAHTAGMSHDSAMAAQKSAAAAQSAGTPRTTRAGQEAFATIAEVVRVLDANPATDWSKVDIEALRQHLIDMDDVTMRAQVESAELPDGAVFHVSGSGRVREAIRRMSMAHGSTITPADGFSWTAEESPAGAKVTVRVTNPSDRAGVARLRALGFLGILSLGDHHRVHHLGIADGSMRGAHQH
jgi:hypothetical protein